MVARFVSRLSERRCADLLGADRCGVIAHAATAWAVRWEDLASAHKFSHSARMRWWCKSLAIVGVLLVVSAGCTDNRVSQRSIDSTPTGATAPFHDQSPAGPTTRATPPATQVSSEASTSAVGVETTARTTTTSTLAFEDSSCVPVDQFERIRNVTLSVELSGPAETLSASMRNVPGVRAVVFTQDGTPTAILAPGTSPLGLAFDTLTSCVSDEDLAAVTSAAETLSRSENKSVAVAYDPFGDRIWIATDIDERTVRAALPQDLTERQLVIDLLNESYMWGDLPTDDDSRMKE